MTQHVAHRASDEIMELKATISRLEAERDLQRKQICLLESDVARFMLGPEAVEAKARIERLEAERDNHESVAKNNYRIVCELTDELGEAKARGAELETDVHSQDVIIKRQQERLKELEGALREILEEWENDKDAEIAEAIAATREECARVAEEYKPKVGQAQLSIADAIRSQGEGG